MADLTFGHYFPRVVVRGAELEDSRVNTCGQYSLHAPYPICSVDFHEFIFIDFWIDNRAMLCDRAFQFNHMQIAQDGVRSYRQTKVYSVYMKETFSRQCSHLAIQEIKLATISGIWCVVKRISNGMGRSSSAGKTKRI